MSQILTPFSIALLVAACLAVIPETGFGGRAPLPEGSTQMVDVFGSPVRALTIGIEARKPGQPVLVLQAGLGRGMESWTPLIEEIDDLAPIVSYDRPGSGESPFNEKRPTPDTATEHLHEVLRMIDVAPPYILVGHSWGGMLIRYYAGAYPDDVVGMVYIDPTDPAGMEDDIFPEPKDAEHMAAMRAEYEALLSKIQMGPGRQDEHEIAMELLRTPLEERDLPEKHDVPTSIILSGLYASWGLSFNDPSAHADYVQGRVEHFLAWTRELSNVTLLLANDAEHYVHYDDPKLVAEGVRRVLSGSAVEDNK